jgi:hypothetical protein
MDLFLIREFLDYCNVKIQDEFPGTLSRYICKCDYDYQNGKLSINISSKYRKRTKYEDVTRYVNEWVKFLIDQLKSFELPCDCVSVIYEKHNNFNITLNLSIKAS